MRSGNVRAIIAAILLPVAIGFGIGCIPFVQNHLHWNLWYVIPISGLIFGLAIGSVQFLGCYFFQARVSFEMIVVFCLTSPLGFFSTEVGTYLTVTVPVRGAGGIPDGNYRISAVQSFFDYMSNRLGSTTINLKNYAPLGSKSKPDSFEIGAAGTTISFLVDLLGASIGALIAVVGFMMKYPFCVRCNCYKKRRHHYQISVPPDEGGVAAINEIAEMCRKQNHDGLVSLLASLKNEHRGKKSHIQVTADERFCAKCGEATVLGNVFSSKQVELNFQFQSTSKV